MHQRLSSGKAYLQALFHPTPLDLSNPQAANGSATLTASGAIEPASGMIVAKSFPQTGNDMTSKSHNATNDDLPRGFSHILIPSDSGSGGRQMRKLLQRSGVTVERESEFTDDRGVKYSVFSLCVQDVRMILYELAKNGMQERLRGINAEPATKRTCHPENSNSSL